MIVSRDYKDFLFICISATGLQVVAANDLKAGDQLLINYGHRSDDELLLNYGFVLGSGLNSG